MILCSCFGVNLLVFIMFWFIFLSGVNSFFFREILFNILLLVVRGWLWCVFLYCDISLVLVVFKNRILKLILLLILRLFKIELIFLKKRWLCMLIIIVILFVFFDCVVNFKNLGIRVGGILFIVKYFKFLNDWIVIVFFVLFIFVIIISLICLFDIMIIFFFYVLCYYIING